MAKLLQLGRSINSASEIAIAQKLLVRDRTIGRLEKYYERVLWKTVKYAAWRAGMGAELSFLKGHIESASDAEEEGALSDLSGTSEEDADQDESDEEQTVGPLDSDDPMDGGSVTWNDDEYEDEDEGDPEGDDELAR